MKVTRRDIVATSFASGLLLLAQAPKKGTVAPKPSAVPAVLFDAEPESPLTYLATVRAEINKAQSNISITPEQQGVLVEAVLKKYPRAASYFEAEARAEEALKAAGQAGARRVSSGAVWDAHFPSTPITVALERANLVAAAAPQGNQPGARQAVDTGSKLTLEDKRLIAAQVAEIQAFVAQGIKEDADRVAMVQAEESKKSGASKAKGVAGAILNRGQRQQKPASLIVNSNPDDGLRFIEPGIADDLANRNKVYAAQGAGYEQFGTVTSLVGRNLMTIRKTVWEANGGQGEPPALSTTSAANLKITTVSSGDVAMAPKDVKIYDAATLDLMTLNMVAGQISGSRIGQFDMKDVYLAGISTVLDRSANKTAVAAKEAGIEVAVVAKETQAVKQAEQRQQQQRQQPQRQESITIRPNIPYDVRRKIPVQLPGTVQVPVPGTKKLVR